MPRKIMWRYRLTMLVPDRVAHSFPASWRERVYDWVLPEIGGRPRRRRERKR